MTPCRKQNVGELIARGRTAEVYAWGEGKILKLFQPWMDRQAVEYEQRLAQAVYAAGVFTPAVGEMIETGGRLGLVYERVEAATLLQHLLRAPWRAKALARQMAELHAAIHACAAADLPPMHRRLAEKIRFARPLSEALRQAALAALEALPQDHRVCHGDFHPGNILVTWRGLMAIDWIDASAGHPLGDLARSELLILHSPLPAVNPLRTAFMKWLRRSFFRAYQERYFSLSDYTSDQVRAWLPVAAAARLSEGIQAEEEHLLRMAQAGLSDFRGQA